MIVGWRNCCIPFRLPIGHKYRGQQAMLPGLATGSPRRPRSHWSLDDHGFYPGVVLRVACLVRLYHGRPPPHLQVKSLSTSDFENFKISIFESNILATINLKSCFDTVASNGNLQCKNRCLGARKLLKTEECARRKPRRVIFYCHTNLETILTPYKIVLVNVSWLFTVIGQQYTRVFKLSTTYTLIVFGRSTTVSVL